MNFRTLLTIFFATLAAIAEGMDFQAAGIAAPAIAKEFAFSKDLIGYVVTGALVGIVIGSFVGGRLADRFGRKPVLVGSVAMFGIFSLATAHAPEFWSLCAARVLTGIGLGGAIPNLIALVSENAGEKFRNTAIGICYGCVPLGSAIVSWVGATYSAEQWRTIFYVGGFTPIAVVPLLIWGIKESQEFRERQAGIIAQQKAPPAMGVRKVLFGEGRALMTSMFFVAFFFTLLAIYLNLNWLTTLLVDKGFTFNDANWVQTVKSLAAVPGSFVFGTLMDRASQRVIATIAFLGCIFGSVALATANTLDAGLIAAAGGGIFMGSIHPVLFALARGKYHALIRGTGIGAAEGVGRCGSVLGPLLTGYALAAGAAPQTIQWMCVPAFAIGLIAALVILRRPMPALSPMLASR